MSNNHNDVVVTGATPAGVASAVRASREGAETCLVSAHANIGGMLSSGLSYLDTLTTKARTPFLEEFVEGVRDHYRSEYGENSPQYELCVNGYAYEPHVAQAVFDELVEAEESLTVLRNRRPTAVERVDDAIVAITVTANDGETATLRGDHFIDATYEGDLAALAGVPFRVGREPREEHGEQFAGRLFTSLSFFYERLGQEGTGSMFLRDAIGSDDVAVPLDSDFHGMLDLPETYRRGELDLFPAHGGISEIFSGSTGAGDGAIQAYNYRVCLSRDPENRRRPERPDGYDREEYLPLETAGTRVLDDIQAEGLGAILRLEDLPNEKADMNTGDLPGENHDYPTADRETRRNIETRHRDYLLGLLYFLQNDEDVPDEIQAEAQEWGLATDEFTDNDNFPWQLYVREGRRMRGRYVLTENDARVARGIDRTPVHWDAISIAEYPVDSHPCTRERKIGSQRDGHVYLSEVTRPSQVPYRSLLPEGLDNLLVPVALSSSHMGFCAVRYEPTWIHIGEAAGFAAGLAVQDGTAPANVSLDRLQRKLVESGVMISFFNEFDMATEEPWAPAVQYLGAKGFFDEYSARPTEALTADVARIWVQTAGALLVNRRNATEHARRIASTGDRDERVTADKFAALLERELDAHDIDADPAEAVTACDLDGGDELTRADACRIAYRLLSAM